MPLRFRAVVRYTLPGVLALIGWWWYIARKKERLIVHDSQEGPPTATGLRASAAEGSNGLLEKGTISPTNDTESPTHIPPRISSQRTEHGNISEEDAADRIRGQEAQKPLASTLPSPGKEDSPQVTDHKDPKQSSALAFELEDHPVKNPDAVEEMILPCQSVKVSSSSHTTTNAERPEPEGEVAKHCGTLHTQDKMVVCAVTPAKVQRVIPSEGDFLEMPLSAQDFNQHLLTSTPSFPALASTTMVQDPATRSENQEDIKVCSGIVEEEDLELLASGLITEVISAATLEVLGITSCQVTENSQPSCSSTLLGSDRLYSQQEPITAAKQDPLLTNPSQMCLESREAEEKGEQEMPNGCSLHRVHQTNGAQRAHWPSPSAAQSAPSLNTQLKDEETAMLAEDSACSTCHSDDGISNEELQNSMFSNQRDGIQVTDCSAREVTQVETTTGATAALSKTDENSVDDVCEIKRLNGMGLRNGALGTCEVETDQSGGETPSCFIWFVSEELLRVAVTNLTGGGSTTMGHYQSSVPLQLIPLILN